MVKSISALGLCLLACLSQVQGGSNLVTRAVTARHSSLPVSITASGASVFPRLSGDGRFVAFMSNAGNLVTNHNAGADFNIFVRDRMSGTTALVSVAANGVEGGNGLSTLGDISADGRYVVFESEASNLVPGDANGESDVFIRDLVLERTKLISQTASGMIGNGRSISPFMTPDARRVLFETSAPNLIPAAPETGRRLVLWDADANSLRLISASLTVPQFFDPAIATPAMSANGSLVAFVTDATNVVAGTPPTLSQVYVRDLESGRAIWASEAAAKLLAPAKVNFGTPVLSGNGKWLFFMAWGYSTRGAWIVQHELSSGVARIIATDDAAVSSMSIEGLNPAGDRLVYQLKGQIYLRRTAEPTPVLISVNKLGTGPANGQSQNAVISEDGAHVIFMSDATDLPDAGGAGFQLYHRDLRTDQTTWLSARPDGLPGADLNEVLPAISADARWVAFESTDEGLVADDLNYASDVFIVDAGAPVVELVSGRDAMVPATTGGNQSSGYLAALPVGRQPPGAFDQTGAKLFFRSDAPDLLASGTNQPGYAGLFVHAVDTGASTEVARETVPLMDGHFWSADGLKVAYFARITPPTPFARPLVAGVVKDLAANVIQVVTILPTGEYETPAPGSPLSISADGNWLAFRSNVNGTFLRDLKNGKTIKPDLSATGVIAHQLSPDGRYLAQSSSSLEVWDAKEKLRFEVGINAELDGRLTFSASGNLLLLNGIQRPIRDEVIRSIYLYSVPGRELLLEYPTRRTGRLAWHAAGEPMLSANGRYLALVDEANKPALGDTNGVADVYVHDVITGDTRLVSVNQSGVRAGNAASTYPAISQDGRYITFLSEASDLTAEAAGRGSQLFARDLWLGKTILVSQSTRGPRGSDASADSPAISPKGRHVAYLSEASDLTPGDFNAHRDIYLAALPDPAALEDADHDGLPDAWERLSFGTLDRDGSGDPDEDGITNLVEYQTGGNPLDALPLRILRITFSREAVSLVWRSRSRFIYAVQRSFSLDKPVWETITRTSGPGEMISFSTPLIPNATGAYYRVVREP